MGIRTRARGVPRPFSAKPRAFPRAAVPRAAGEHVPAFGGSPAAASEIRQRFHVERRFAAARCVVVPHGELDVAAVPVLEAELLAAIDEADSLLLDLRRLTFVDSCGLWLITLSLSSCRRAGVAFTLTRGPERVHSIFEVTGLSDVLPFVDADDAR